MEQGHFSLNSICQEINSTVAYRLVKVANGFRSEAWLKGHLMFSAVRNNRRSAEYALLERLYWLRKEEHQSKYAVIVRYNQDGQFGRESYCVDTMEALRATIGCRIKTNKIECNPSTWSHLRRKQLLRLTNSEGMVSIASNDVYEILAVVL